MLPVALAAAAVPLGVLGTPAPQAASTVPVKHVVVLYLENHSFDNVLGYWCDQTHRCVGMPSSVTLKNGTVVTPGVTPDTVPPVDHSVRAQQTAVDSGRMDGWGQISGCGAATGYACISGYQPSGVPNLTALASRFAISDETFSMHPDGTAQGPRAPLLIVSSYARPGYTDTTPTTFAGILTYVEQTLGLRSMAKNDAASYGFANAFNCNQKPLAPVRMVQRPLPASARHLPPPDPDDPT
jgi:phospholipase C